MLYNFIKRISLRTYVLYYQFIHVNSKSTYTLPQCSVMRHTHITAAFGNVLILPPGGALFYVKQGIGSFFCGPSLKLPQVVVEGLDVGKHTHGVWFSHVF